MNIREAAVRYLENRPRTCTEMKRRLTEKGFEKEEIEKTVEELISLVNGKDLLDEHLYNVGDHLQRSPGTHTHRTQPALEPGANLTLKENHEYGEHRIEQQDNGTYGYALNENGPKIS